MLRTLPHRVLPVALLLVVAGCMSWSGARPLSGFEAPGVGSEVIRVLRTDGTLIVLHDPVIANDSLAGALASKNGMRLAIPVSDVQEIQSRRVDPLRTTGAIAGGLLGGWIAFWTIVFLAVPW